MSARLLGVDVGGTKTALVLAEAGSGARLGAARFETRPERGPEAWMAELIEAARGLAGEAPPAAVGVASAGPLDLEAGAMVKPPNFPGWGTVPLAGPLEAALGAPVALDNDANAAALAEALHGAGQGAASVLYVTISTGLGAGIVLNGEVWRGLGAGAGEIGHLLVDPSPEALMCGCGNRGCLEAIASGTGIARRMAARLGPEAAPVPAAEVLARARAGDPLAGRVWEDTLHALAVGLGGAVTTLAPHALVLGGGVAMGAGPALVEALRPRLAERARLVPVGRMRLALAALGGDAGLAGALALAAGKLAAPGRGMMA